MLQLLTANASYNLAIIFFTPYYFRYKTRFSFIFSYISTFFFRSFIVIKPQKPPHSIKSKAAKQKDTIKPTTSLTVPSFGKCIHIQLITS